MPRSIYEKLYRADLPSFTQLAFHELQPRQELGTCWHIGVMADALQGCLDRGTRRLILNAPPRSLKSHCALAAVVFALGHNPTLKIMVVAGTRALARDLQLRTAALMRNPRCRVLFPHLQVTEVPGEIILPHGGGIFYAVVGQSLIGRGADLIVIDDPLASHLAQDDPAREFVNAWFDAEVIPRLNDKANGVIILVMQRLHPHDLTGHVCRHGGWSEIVLPAVALHDEEWTLHRRRAVVRRKGEPLQPHREGTGQLIEILREIEAYNFSAQYLQQPLQSPSLQRVGFYHNPRPINWQPEMGLSKVGFVKIRESRYILFEVFGAGPQPPYASASLPYSDEEWEAAAQIQQKRLVANAQGDRDRCQEQRG
ncbi:hypothetical protein ACLBXB_08795 [Methylobacterium mesophilicum]